MVAKSPLSTVRSHMLPSTLRVALGQPAPRRSPVPAQPSAQLIGRGVRVGWRGGGGGGQATGYTEKNKNNCAASSLYHRVEPSWRFSVIHSVALLG